MRDLEGGTDTHTQVPSQNPFYERRCSTCIYCPHLTDSKTDTQAGKMTRSQLLMTALGSHRLGAKKQWGFEGITTML